MLKDTIVYISKIKEKKKKTCQTDLLFFHGKVSS